MTATLRFAVLALTSLAVVDAYPNLHEILGRPEFQDHCGNRFYQELAASGVDRLDSKKEFTVFVPKDSAMKKLRKTLKRSSFTRRNRKNFINKHVVSGALDIKTLRTMGKDGESLKTIDGHKVRFNDQKPTKIIFGDEEYRLIGVIEASNGYAYCIQGALADVRRRRRRRSKAAPATFSPTFAPTFSPTLTTASAKNSTSTSTPTSTSSSTSGSSSSTSTSASSTSTSFTSFSVSSTTPAPTSTTV